MKIKRASIVIFPHHADKISLITDLPSPTPKVDDAGETLWLSFDAEKGTGVDYVKNNFHLEGEIEVVEVPNRSGKFSKEIKNEE